MFKFKKIYLFAAVILICAIGVLSGTVGVARADTATTTPSITVLSPNGGEVWRVGETRRITWVSNGFQNVTIDLYDDRIFTSGALVLSIVGYNQLLASQGYYDWTIPQSVLRENDGKNFQIIVRDANSHYLVDKSDASFSIEENKPDLTIKDIRITSNCPLIGQSLTGKMYVTVANIGNVSTDSSKQIKLSFVLESSLGFMKKYIDYIPANTTRDIELDLNHAVFIGPSLKIIAFIDSDAEKDSNGNFINTGDFNTKNFINTYLYIDESNESNNIFIKTIPICVSIENKPDFIVKNIYIEKVDNNNNIFVEFENIGGTSEAELLKIEVVDMETNDKYYHNVYYPGLGKLEPFGPEYRDTIKMNSSVKFKISGIYNLKATIDYQNVFNESNENNNTLEKTITISTSTITCVKENESLGAVVPDNNEQCCEGLRPYITPGIIGTRGICKKIEIFFPQPTASDPQTTQINTNANQLHNNQFEAILAELKQLRDKIREQANEIKYLRNLTTGVKNLAQPAKDAINNFITYGVDSNTQKLGAGERAAVMYSFKSAFNKLPETEQELADAIKIGNGRWPSARNENAEKKAKKQFEKIYKKIADMNNANDNAAITVMAYGLRQKAENRNLNSERAGIKIFNSIYKHNPKTTEEWNAMQAIAYSGSARGIDTDGDLLLDEREKQLGTDPNNSDTDGDGYKDGEEVANGFDPLRK